jgi:putative glutamine amidotransferase
VKAVGAGLVVSASSPDGVVEAIEVQAKDQFVLGVQWHPELMVDTVPPNLGIYRTFVHRARDRRH